MTVHIWGRLSSLNVRKVVWAAQETGVAFTRSDAGMAFGVVKTPEYLAAGRPVDEKQERLAAHSSDGRRRPARNRGRAR